MGTLNAFYVRAGTEHDVTAAAISARFPNIRVQADTQFWQLTLPDDAFGVPQDDLAELSSQLETDVLWLSFQSVVDAFQFHHWRAGELLRSLVYGCFVEERKWERVEGAPEPWEREVFFSASDLQCNLKDLESDSAKSELQRVWRGGEIVPGRIEPSLDARECARKVAEHFHLSGWGVRLC